MLPCRNIFFRMTEFFKNHNNDSKTYSFNEIKSGGNRPYFKVK